MDTLDCQPVILWVVQTVVAMVLVQPVPFVARIQECVHALTMSVESLVTDLKLGTMLDLWTS